MRSLARNSAMEELVEQTKDFLKSNPSGKLVIHLYCTSDRHRSVGVATVMFHVLDISEWRTPELIHFHGTKSVYDLYR
jgi:RNase adaptor protein for sRNA GlmZ degradation